jgi:hypothetical protein
MTEPTQDPEDQLDPDADPANLNPRDDREETPYDGDPDADPNMLNPRDTLGDAGT